MPLAVLRHLRGVPRVAEIPAECRFLIPVAHDRAASAMRRQRSFVRSPRSSQRVCLGRGLPSAPCGRDAINARIAGSSMATSTASVRRLPHLVGLSPVFKLVRVGVTHGVDADSLNNSAIPAPMLRPIPHVMIRRVVNHAMPMLAKLFGVGVNQAHGAPLTFR